MSATTAPPPPPGAPPAIDFSATPRVPLARLVAVELRKAVDTRAGRWYMISILSLCLVVLGIFMLLVPESEQSFSNALSVAGGLLGYFLPILPILLITAEAGQRTGLVTFALEPRRSRVVVAKFLASLGLALGVMVVAVVLAALSTFLGLIDGGSLDWSLEAQVLINSFLIANVISVLIGFALGTLLMNTPAAIVGYFVYTLILPTVAGFLSAVNETIADIVPWVEFNTAQVPLFTGDFTPTGQEWAQFATAGTLWLVIPLTFGVLRLLRVEFK